MEVKHRLAGSFAAIQHRAVALKELAFPSKLRGDQLQLSEYHLILLACVRQRFEMFPWANQDVRRRLRADILANSSGSSYTIFDGICFAPILQNKQSLFIEFLPRAVQDPDA